MDLSKYEGYSRKSVMRYLRRYKGLKLEEIASIYGLSKERIRQLTKGYNPIKRIVEHKNRPDQEMKFWMRVRIPDDTEKECWEWVGIKTPLGYGHFTTNNSKHEYAHRYSYQLHKGKIEGGKYVCHTCDNPGCVNPNHLWVGTAKENTHDSMNKGRWNKNGRRGKREANAPKV